MWKILKSVALLSLMFWLLLCVTGCTAISHEEKSDDQTYPLPGNQVSWAITAYPIPDISIQPTTVTTRSVAPSSLPPSSTPVIASESIRRNVIDFFAQYQYYAVFIDSATFSPYTEYYGCVNSDNKGMVVGYVVNKPLEIVRSSVENLFQNKQWNYQEKQLVGEENFNGIMWFMSAQPSLMGNEEHIFVDFSILESSAIDPGNIKAGTPEVKMSDIRVNIRYIVNAQNYNNNSENIYAALLETCNGESWLIKGP